MKRGIFVFLCYIGFICIGYYAPEGLCNIKGAPCLNVPESFHSFGHIYRGQKVQHLFLLKNVGEANLEIKAVNASCGCTAAAPSQKIIPPMGEAYIEVTFNSTNFTGKVKKTVSVETNDPQEPVHTLTLEAYVIEEVTATPPRLTLGQIKQGEGRNLQVEIKSPLGLDLKVPKAQSSSKAIMVNSIERQPNGEYIIQLEVKKDSQPGRFSGDLVVYTSSQHQPTITIPFFGEVVGHVSVFPPQLSFGLVRKGKAVSRQVLVTLHDQETKLTNIQIEPEVFSFKRDVQKGGTFCRIDVTLNKEAPTGTLAGKLKIHTTSKTQPLISIPISASVKE